MSPELF